MKINRRNMRILITNDDGYEAKGIKVLADIMSRFGEVTVIAPKKHQSGMSMALSLGFKQIAHKDMGNGWHYVDATPASCVKFGLNTMFLNDFPDVVVSGINHGSNASVASCYSGTLGAAAEAALNGIPAIGVSLDSLHPNPDFSGVSRYFGEIFAKLMDNYPDKYGITPEMVGQSSNPVIEEGEDLYMMVGEFQDDPHNTPDADHRLVQDGYISVVAHNVDCTDYLELERLRNIF